MALVKRVRRTNPMALVSVFAGAVSWSLAPLLASVIAIYCGNRARAQIRETGEDGRVLAWMGLALGYANLALIGLLVPIYLLLLATSSCSGGGH